MVLESIYVEKGAKDIWKYQNKMNHFHHYGSRIIFSVRTVNDLTIFMPPRPQPAGGIERSGCPYVRTSVRRLV